MSNFDDFEKLNKRTKKLYIDLILKGDKYRECCIKAMSNEGFDFSNCKSPMEELFNAAFNVVSYDEKFIDTVDNERFILIPQFDVICNDKKYIADFLVAYTHDDSVVSTYILVEIDGHEFHAKTKEQVAHDNEREYDLKMQGYDILRFSGSQVYNSPCNCAYKTLTYVNGGW